MKRPNIVFILADDTGWGDVGCNNPESKIPTPSIDRVASQGIRFTNAHSSCAYCTPSRYGLMTGRYMWRSSKGHALVMPYQPPIIEPERPTLASMLRSRGYATACVGKWHLGLLYPAKEGLGQRYTEVEREVDFTQTLDGGPIERGFDYFFGSAGCSTSDAPYAYIENNRTVGIPSIPSTEDLHALPGFWPGLMEPDWRMTEVDPMFCRKAIEFVDRHAASHPADPFFLYLAISAPHNPWVPPDFVTGASGDGPRGDMGVLVDWCVGQMYDAFAQRGILDDTLFIFTSDNGPQYNTGKTGHRAAGPYRGRKNEAFEGGHREPFVARWPGKIAAGTTSGETICLTDMMATFAALTGAAMPDGAGEDSFNMLPAILGQGECERRPALINDTGGFYATTGDFAITRGQRKLIITQPRERTGEPERRYLFDMENDPYETRNLVDEEPTMAKDLERLLGEIKERGLRSVEV